MVRDVSGFPSHETRYANVIGIIGRFLANVIRRKHLVNDLAKAVVHHIMSDEQIKPVEI
jgi:hypothetical protein